MHFALGQFGGQWHQFDPLHNGTVAEVSLLTDAPFGRPGTLTNHCIVTFGDTDALTYEILYAAATTRRGNTIRCEIPNFMFDRAKKRLKFAEFGELLALQVLAGIDGIRLAPGAVAHFHSWEAGFLAESPDVLAAHLDAQDDLLALSDHRATQAGRSRPAAARDGP